MTINMKRHEAAVDEVLANLKTFLMQPDHGEGEWPKVPDEELFAAYDLVGQLFSLKWGKDADGDAPMRVRIWHRAQEHPVADFAFIEHGPHQEDESAADREARILKNLSVISTASAACAEELRRLHFEMADIHSRKLRKNAAITVHHVRYKATPEWDAGEHGADYPASIHQSAEAAEQFIAEQQKAGLTVARRSSILAVPSSRDNAKDGFAEFRRKVEGQFDKLLPDMATRQSLNLQPSRVSSKDAAA